MTTQLQIEAKPDVARPASRMTPDKLKSIIARHHFCTLATTSTDGNPHIVAVTYQLVDGHLYVATAISSKKARNIRANPRVAVHIPVRQYPMGPPWSVQFQTTASILEPNDPDLVRLLESGRLQEPPLAPAALAPLKKIAGIGVMKEPDGCFLKVKLPRKIHTYGLGLSFREVMRDLAHGDRTIVVDWAPKSAEGGE